MESDFIRDRKSPSPFPDGAILASWLPTVVEGKVPFSPVLTSCLPPPTPAVTLSLFAQCRTRTVATIDAIDRWRLLPESGTKPPSVHQFHLILRPSHHRPVITFAFPLTTYSQSTMAKAATEPASPTTPGYSLSDRASFGSPGSFSRTSSSDTSHSSQSSVEDAVVNPADEGPRGDVTPLPPASARTAGQATHRPVKVPSTGAGSLVPDLKPSAETSGSRIPVPFPRPETALDRLPEPVPGFTKALREDVAVEVALFGSEVQAHVLRVEGKVDRIQLTIDKQQSVNVQPRVEVADSGAGDVQHVAVGTANQDVLSSFMEQYLQKTAKIVSEQVEKSTKATEERLTKFETEMSGRFTKFSEEMAGKFTQLEKDVANQIRVELRSEKEKYQSTMALYELVGELTDGPFGGDPSDVDREERLSELFDQLKVTVTSPRSSLELDVPSSFELVTPSALKLDVPSSLELVASSALEHGAPSALEHGAPLGGPSSLGGLSSLAASSSPAALPVPAALPLTPAVRPDPSPPSLIQVLVQIIRITATYIPPMRRLGGRPGKKE